MTCTRVKPNWQTLLYIETNAQKNILLFVKDLFPFTWLWLYYQRTLWQWKFHWNGDTIHHVQNQKLKLHSACLHECNVRAVPYWNIKKAYPLFKSLNSLDSGVACIHLQSVSLHGISGHSGLHSFPALTLLGQKWIGKDTLIIIIVISFSFWNNGSPPPPHNAPIYISLLPWLSWEIWEHTAVLLLSYTRDAHQYHISIVLFCLACHGIEQNRSNARTFGSHWILF